ncbi:cytochrome c3 family protein [Aurantimonas sp. VKM B-3413]|uniref:cytochrome c3 family protein n=1 Tax=Aurantimonas sp. VKM B-3413 TaxID=2779401 RepID=UPI001E56459B|nr:cytochrome c3 family protein [Aurantimonas sp. VKM B-3413]MCB8839658.1 cytochrome C [Aurantimonas sp. VKM B-3413]
MAQIFSRRADLYFRLGLIAVLGLPIVLAISGFAYYRSSYFTKVGEYVAQPVPFSHKHHAGELGIDCRYCHTGVEKAAFAGLPPTETCMTCHSQLWTNAPMLAPVRLSLATDTPLRWQRVHDLPDYVYFDHSVHVNNGVGCSSCHGNVKSMPLMMKAEPLSMGWCLDCHRDPAKNLRREDEIFDMTWHPAADQDDKGRMLLAHYGIRPDHLTDCSVCHR